LGFIQYPEWLRPEVIPGLPIRWYGLMYIVAFLITYLLASWQVKRGAADVEQEEVVNFFFWGIIGLLIGARIFATLIYDTSGRYLAKPWLILWPFDGRGNFVGLQGMSYHGGVVGVIVATFIYCRRRKWSFLQWADIVVAGIPLGYTFGRLGNFINGELYGRVATVAWGMVFPQAPGFPADQEWVKEAAAKAGKMLHIQLAFLYTEATTASKMVVDSGELGHIYYAAATQYRRRGRPYVDGYGTARFVQKAQSGGGALYDMGIYEISRMLYLLGNPTVARITGKTYQEIDMLPERAKELDVEEFATGMVFFEGNLTMAILSAWAINLDPFSPSCIAGSKGGVHLLSASGIDSVNGREVEAHPVAGKFEHCERLPAVVYQHLPAEAFIWGHGGAVGWGTLCGTLNGAGIVTSFAAGKEGEEILNDVIAWYSETELPIYKPVSPKTTFKSTNVSESPLCHISVGKWMKKEGVALKSPERKDRCARVAADVAFHTVTLLNKWADGKFEMENGSQSAEYGITAQNNCMECHGDDVPEPKDA